MEMTGAKILMECLLEQGVDTVFGYPGGTILNVYDELYRYRDRITHILTAHEQGASHAADGYARATGRTGVVLAMAWGMVFVTRSGSVTRKIRAIDGRSWLFLILSGLCTGGSWLCQNRSLQLIDASLATPIDKLSILITIAFSWLVFGEKLHKKAAAGLALLVAGTLGLLL